MGLSLLSMVCLISFSSNYVTGLDNRRSTVEEFAVPDDVYKFLWSNNSYISHETLKLDFLKRMESGNLPAERYINFTIQDINYLVNVTALLRDLRDKVKEPADLSQFLKGKYESYKNFAISFLNQYNLKGVSDIKPTPAMGKYLSDYAAIMKTKEPIYFVVSMLPCSRLWVWLANNLNMNENNAYIQWKIDNMHGHPEKFKPLLNKYLDTQEKVTEANTVFRQQMQNEHDFFATS
ncbi:uncharacterized protein LOC114765104 [Denticeps clupeoides]|uniref:Uncharacterized protein n=1 Tax=Denticeps clupeoides TaxID=299321 RepID=A0AAY4EXX1_9TELE|nr:uncharacterized protein LOC114765104 [Denticeps clupeoides]